MLSQSDRLYDLLSDGKEHSTIEIMKVIYGADHLGLSRIGARIDDIKHGRWSGKREVKILGKVIGLLRGF